MYSLKDLINIENHFISITDTFEIIKNNADLKSDADIAKLLLNLNINNSCITYNKIQDYEGNPEYIELDNRLFEMNKLLSQVINKETFIDTNKLNNLFWKKEDFFNFLDEKNKINLLINSSNSHTEHTIRFGNIRIHQTVPNIESLNAEIKLLQTEIERLKKLKNKENTLINLIFDETAQDRYAPDLALSIKLWSHLYIDDPKQDSHSSKANKWIEKYTSYNVADDGGIESIKRIREITTPLSSWSNQRNGNYKK